MDGLKQFLQPLIFYTRYTAFSNDQAARSGTSNAPTPGGFFSSGARMRHDAWTTGDTLIQVSGMGPFDVLYVDPREDPSNAAKK